jgi:diguanylate cyclase (GGDEF)-like protein/PAS domain S-box-containing protein
MCDEDLREIFENSGDIIYIHDFDGMMRLVNPAIERISGYSHDEILGMKITDIIVPEHAHFGLKMLDSRISGEAPISCEFDILTKNGGRVTLSVSARPIFRGGKPVAVQGIARDITKRRQEETALFEAKEKLETQVDELCQRRHDEELLNEMSDILRACSTVDEAYKVIVRFANQIFPAKVGALYILTPSRDVAEPALVWGEQELAGKAFLQTECWALRRGKTHSVESDQSGLVCKHVRHPIPGGCICIPLMAQSEAIGALHLTQPDNVRMTEGKQRLAVAMAERVALTLYNLRLHETLRIQAIRDPLTGLFNRRFMEESLELEMRRAARNQRPLGMIMIDLDHFKYFNDTFGHEAGDLLLKQIGMLLRTNIRAEDIACRYGGEEFTLILPEGNSWVTRRRANFYKDAIQNLGVNFKGTPLGRITASMGVAVFPEHGRTAQALIEAADKAMYQSKDAGRDRVTMARTNYN